jgi:hypothetical protein
MKKKRKKSKNSSNYHMSILPILFIGKFLGFENEVSLLITGYFLWTYLKAYGLLRDNEMLSKEIKVTASMESFLYYVYNAQTQLYMSNTMQIVEKDPTTVVSGNVNLVLGKDAVIHEVIYCD